MADDDTLLGHLVTKLTGDLEDAATDALAYILSKSDDALGAFNELLRHGGFEIEPITRVRTQVSYEEGDSRPDMTGYDKKDAERLLVESKFGAPLLEGQASHYIKHLDKPGPAVLLFVSPEVRIPTLWAEIRRQMQEDGHLEEIAAPSGVHRARLVGTERHLMLISWIRLLDYISAHVSDAAARSDIAQLRGLVLQQDSEAFLPIHPEHLNSIIGRRVGDYYRLVDDICFARGQHDGWMVLYGVTSYPYGHGRHFSFSDVSGGCWFGVNPEQWAKDGDTPLWLQVGEELRASVGEIRTKLNLRTRDRWVPIHPKTGVERATVLDDVVCQLKSIAKILRGRP